jgi:methionyl-tRNA formyltransferase
VIVWGARPVELEDDAPAGTIVDLGVDGAVVACGEGGLLLEEIQTEAPELAVGARLG